VKTFSLFQALHSEIRSILSSIVSSLTSLPLSKAGAKVDGLFSQTNLIHITYVLNMVLLLIFNTKTVGFFRAIKKKTEKEDDNSIYRLSG
jgi:hypothetical protein